MISSPISIPMDHPSLAGHFPGNPIVPGVLILEEVLNAAETCYQSSFAPKHWRNIKFLSPLQPGIAFTVEFKEKDGGLNFTCTSSGPTIATGFFTRE